MSDGNLPPGTPPAEADWTQQVTDLVVDTVDNVREKTTGPVLRVSQSSVSAFVALILIIPALAILLIGVIRLLDWAIPGDVWIVYAILGTIFTLTGFILWSKRSTDSTRP